MYHSLLVRGHGHSVQRVYTHFIQPGHSFLHLCSLYFEHDCPTMVRISPGTVAGSMHCIGLIRAELEMCMSLPQSSNVTTVDHEQHRRDTEQLAQLGYRQELRRTMSTFSNFAVAFSYLSVTTGIFALFAFGLGTGGPAFIWSWPLVFAGQLLVGLVFAELASHYPLAGSVFQWSKHVGNKDVA